MAIVVGDMPILEKWAKENGIEGDHAAILNDQKTKDLIKQEITTRCRGAKLFGFEIPTEFYLTKEAFTVENNLLTPTFKLKRNDAKMYFLKEIKEMYKGAKLQGEK